MAPVPSLNKLQAQLAYDYTQGIMLIGRGNKVGNNVKKVGTPFVLTAISRSIDSVRKALGADPDGDKRVPSGIRFADNRAHEWGVGNCGEYASVGFMYLFNKNIHPIDYFTGKPDVDHEFLVVGRLNDSKDDDPETWGDDCWISDGWHGKVFPASQFRAQAFEGRAMRPRSDFRYE